MGAGLEFQGWQLPFIYLKIVYRHCNLLIELGYNLSCFSLDKVAIVPIRMTDHGVVCSMLQPWFLLIPSFALKWDYAGKVLGNLDPLLSYGDSTSLPTMYLATYSSSGYVSHSCAHPLSPSFMMVKTKAQGGALVSAPGVGGTITVAPAPSEPDYRQRTMDVPAILCLADYQMLMMLCME